MHFLQLLPLASLALALPQASVNLKRSAACGAQEWAIQGFESFQLPANFTPAEGTPAPFKTSHLTFTWIDPNLNVSGTCEWLNLGGKRSLTASRISAVLVAPLACRCPINISVVAQSRYRKRQSLVTSECNIHRPLCTVGCKADHVTSATYTLSGGTTLALECFEMFGGQSCETVTQVNVPITFLEQIG